MLSLALDTGSVCFNLSTDSHQVTPTYRGDNKVYPLSEMIRQGKEKLVILINNCPVLRKSEIDYYGMLAKTGVQHYSGNTVEMGTASGKYIRYTLAIIDLGDSDTIRSMLEQTCKQQITHILKI